MLSILALDVSKTNLGWAFGLPTDTPISGVHPLGRDGETEDEVFRNGLVWLTRQMSDLSPAIVAIEAPIKTSGGGFTNPASQSMLLGLQGVLRAVVKAKLPGRAHLIASSTARKTFCGKGTFAKGEAKDAVMMECRRRMFLSLEDLQPDRADAICLWTHMAAQQIPELAFHQPKRRAAA
jgi:hypothetical protein